MDQTGNGNGSKGKTVKRSKRKTNQTPIVKNDRFILFILAENPISSVNKHTVCVSEFFRK